MLDSLILKENVMFLMVLDKKLVDDMENKVEEFMKMFEIYGIVNKYLYSVLGG